MYLIEKNACKETEKGQKESGLGLHLSRWKLWGPCSPCVALYSRRTKP